uniref:Uncharacterized protein n=1 Tax=Ditylenchus dipsaci TaxID=166011 RepID=A0A915D4V8_9BILA
MKVSVVHKGCYLLCRTITEAFVTVATCSLIEDLREDVERIFLYNFRCDLTDSKWLPEGTIMAIKEPFLEFATSDKGQVMLRVDSPSDIVFIDKNDENTLKNVGALKWFKKQCLTPNQLKLKGNECFGKKQFEDAIKWYRKGLLIKPDFEVLHLNLSAALLSLGQYYKAYEEASKALQLGADKAKSLLRLGRAAYGMKNWELAFKHFQDFNRHFPSSQDAVVDLTRVQTRLKESRSGIYDLNFLASEAIDKKVFFMDVADYTGPVVIDDIKGKGKGILATKDIEKGTLLMVSKAFSIYCGSEHPDIQLDAFNLISNMPASKTQALNIIKTMQTLLQNPDKAEDFYSLHSGDLSRDVRIPAGKRQ